MKDATSLNAGYSAVESQERYEPSIDDNDPNGKEKQHTGATRGADERRFNDDNDTICTQTLLHQCEEMAARISGTSGDWICTNIRSSSPESHLTTFSPHAVPLAPEPPKLCSFGILAILLATLSISLMVGWNHSFLMMSAHSFASSNSESDTNHLLLQWHDFWMNLAFCFLTVAMVFVRFTKKTVNCSDSSQHNNHNLRHVILRKSLHGLLWILITVSACIALMVPKVSSRKNQRDSHRKPINQAWSLRNFVGAMVVLLYVGQLVLGCLLLRCCSSTIRPKRAKLQQWYRRGALVAYGMTSLAILLGTQEQGDLAGCNTTMEEDPRLAYWQLGKQPCTRSRWLGLLLLLMTLCTLFDLGGKEDNLVSDLDDTDSDAHLGDRDEQSFGEGDNQRGFEYLLLGGYLDAEGIHTV